MPGWLIAAIVFLIIAIVLGVIAFLLRPGMVEEEVAPRRPRGYRYSSTPEDEEEEPGTQLVPGERSQEFVGVRAGAIVCAVLALLFTAIASVHTVPTRQVGIVTQFNKHTGQTREAGFQMTWPWQKVEDWKADRQTYDHLGADGTKNGCIWVRITGLDTACVEILVEWETKREKAPEQWAAYRKSFDFFTEKRVEPNLRDAINAAFRAHDPVKTVDANSAEIVPVDMNAFKPNVTGEINGRLADDINVLRVTFGQIHYSKPTQDNINAFRAKVMEKRNLEQDEKNAAIRKRITDKNSEVNPVTRCLEIAASKPDAEPGLCLTNPQLVRPVQ